jgi:hypothetical protein
MAKIKYGYLTKELIFQEQGLGPYQQGLMLSPETLGIDVYVEIGSCLTAGNMG